MRTLRQDGAMATQTVTMPEAYCGTVFGCCAPIPVAQPSHPDTFCNILESIGLDTTKLSKFFAVLAMTL
jgi:hypothetical protein